MQILPFRGGTLVCFLVSLLLVASFWNVDGKTVEVVGAGECADCAENNFDTNQAFSGLHVTIDCKPENGEFKARGSGELDKEGNFKVSIPEDLVKDGKLKEECYAQLHSVSAGACPAHDGLESSKIVFKSTGDEKHQFGLKGKLKFSPITCASASFWPHFKHPPLKSYHHHPLFHPIYKKPLPPPIHKPPVPVYKPPVYKPPPVPVYKKPLPPPVPVYKPPVYEAPPVPVYKKPLPPPVPIYKPKPLPPIPHKPLPPLPPIPHKPLPPLPKIPPFHKKPCPPLPELPPIPKIPPKYFHHPKFGKWPPLPPHHP